MPRLRIAQAARLAGVSRSALDRALRDGRVSFEIDQKGARWIDASEIARVYGGTTRVVPGTPARDARERPEDPVIEQLQLRIAALEAQIFDLRGRLDAAEAERRELTLRLLPAPRWWHRWRR